jgi:hypothetical protein
MDWLNSHTVDSLPSPAQEEPSVFPCGHYDIDYPMYDSFYNPSSTTQVVDPPLIATEEPTAATPPSPQDQKNEIVIPSTEQIKLLIELAKKQLALREQQAKAGGLTPEPDTPPIKLEEMPTVKLEELSSTTNTLSAAEVAASTSAAVAAPLSLFPPTVSIPDTISPESLIKTEKQMRRDSAISEDGPMSLEAYAESDGIDIKKLTSKERRQLRNKISARNFRVRRKGK